MVRLFPKIVLLFGALVLLTTVSLSVRADPLQEGLRAYDRQDFQIAKQALDPLAASGDADAQLTLGLMFGRGQGVQRDLDVAVDWFKRAAENPKASERVRSDAAYNREFVMRKQKEWAESQAAEAAQVATQAAAQVELARKILALKAAQAAEDRRKEYQDAQIESVRARTRAVEQRENTIAYESARRRQLRERSMGIGR
jgi:hypothetical protein